MSVQGILENARQRPDHHKKIIAFCGSAVLTLAIFAGWAFSLPGQWAMLSSSVSAQSQPAAAELSVVNPSSTSATQVLQQNFSQGVQFLNSFKDSLGGLFSGNGSNYGTAGSNSPSNPTVSILGTTPVPVQASPSNPYGNLKYYVSNGVLITTPKSQ